MARLSEVASQLSAIVAFGEACYGIGRLLESQAISGLSRFQCIQWFGRLPRRQAAAQQRR
jgi:hypothetical protein